MCPDMIQRHHVPRHEVCSACHAMSWCLEQMVGPVIRPGTWQGHFQDQLWNQAPPEDAKCPLLALA